MDEAPPALETSRATWWPWWGLAMAVALVLYALNLVFGDLNQDEGWYLYAARLVSERQLPYVDFAHTQPPVLCFTYGLAWPLVARWGVEGGRLFTAMLGLAGALLAAVAARRLAPAPRRDAAALLAFALVALNAYHTYFTTIVKTYALCGFFLAAAIALLTVQRGRIGRLAAYLAGVGLALAAGTRISAGVMIPVALAGLWCVRDRRPGDWVRLGIGAGVVGLLFAAPFLWLAPDSFLFGVFHYHTGRRTDNLTTWFVYRAGFVSRFVQAYFVPVSVAIAAAAARFFRAEGRCRAPDESAWLRRTAWAGVAGGTLLHITAAVPYEDYQVILAPLAAVALASWVAALLVTAKAERWVVAVLIMVSIGAAFSSPINQSWFVSGRDRIWWRLKEKPHLQVLRETAARVRALAGDSRRLLTQDTYLAVEAGLRVPRGLELGPFSYYPDLDTATARSRHVLNRELMQALLRSGPAPVAAVSGYGLSVASPAVAELPEPEQRSLRAALAERYIPAGTVRPFGQADTTLELFIIKP